MDVSTPYDVGGLLKQKGIESVSDPFNVGAYTESDYTLCQNSCLATQDFLHGQTAFLCGTPLHQRKKCSVYIRVEEIAWSDHLFYCVGVGKTAWLLFCTIL